MCVVPVFTGTTRRRLVGAPGVVGAIGQTFRRCAAAEVKIRIARIANRPFADAIGQRQDGRAGNVFNLNR